MEVLEKEEVITTVNPATGHDIEEHKLMTNDEAKSVVEECHQAFLNWKLKPAKERAEIIKGIGESLQEHKDELTKLMTLEMGKLLRQSIQEVDLCTGICDYTAKNGPEQLADEERELLEGGRGILTYSPIGIVYGIQPWNFPAYQVTRYAIANLMAGNGVLLKHAQNVTGTAKLLIEIFEKGGLPKNLFSLLVIDHDQSDKIIENDLVRGVTLTGSPKAGKYIGKLAGSLLKKTVLELGSNDAYIVLEDADLQRAVKYSVQGRTYNNGETCIAAKRFVVVDAVYEEFKKAFVSEMKQLKTGDPASDTSDLGPIAREDLRKELHKQVEESVEKGAEILCGGEIPDGEGYYYPATVLGNVKPGQPAYEDEFFGPVASLIHAQDAEDAMRIANDSRFGLGGGIFSKDTDRAIKLAQQHFDTGMVYINAYGLAQPNMPFGGVKNSGYGREHGGFGVLEFVNAKSVMIITD